MVQQHVRCPCLTINVGISTSGSVLVGSSVSVLSCISTVLIMAVAILVECDVQPFDLLECESEVVCGYMVDYGGVLFMILYLSAGVMQVLIAPCTYSQVSTAVM